MMTTAFLYHPDFRKHDTGRFHPECPDRLDEIVNQAESLIRGGRLKLVHPEPACPEWIEYIHSSFYRERVESSCRRGLDFLDTDDSPICRDSCSVAMLAAGTAVGGVESVIRNGFRHAFCCLRPPGHHAEIAASMGFCLFNNAAIAAAYAIEKCGLERVFILDWDVHHGNGTQEAFYESGNVYYASIHQDNHFPHSGASRDRGYGEGRGFTLNCPLPAGSGMKDYGQVLENLIIPEIEKFHPQLVILSCGFDAHWSDPLGDMTLTEEDFGELTVSLIKITDRFCPGKLVSILEGGYNPEYLPKCAVRHLSALISSHK